MTTTTLRELRHNFASVEKAAKRGPVEITRRGRVIGTYVPAGKAKAGKAGLGAHFASRAIRLRTSDTVTALDFLDR